MADAKRTLRIVPPPAVEDGGGYRRPAKCPMCGDLLAGLPVLWAHMETDPADLRRCVHARCLHDMQKFLQSLHRGAGRITPTI